MYKPIKITLEAIVGTEEFKYELDLRGTLTDIVGDSATGKSLLCAVARNCRDEYKEQYGGQLRVYDYLNYETLDDFLNTVALETKDCLILVDNGDDFLTTKQMQLMAGDYHNHYIIMRRNAKGVPLSPNYFAEMYQDKDGVFKLRYEYNNPRWFA